MEHSESLETNAAERYLLEEMSAGERDAFEEHYFDCSECAGDVKDGARMMAAGREILREPAAKKVVEMRPKRSFTGWIPQVAAAGIIGGVLGWYGAVSTAVPKVATIEPAAHYDLLMEKERAAVAEGPTSVRTGKTAILTFSIPTKKKEAESAASYVVSIRNAAGESVYAEAVSLDQAADPISLVARPLPGGSYQVVIEGVRKDGQRFSIDTSGFEVVSER